MTDAERSLLLAFIDSTINQMQALRGAVSLLCKEPGKLVSQEKAQAQNEDLFGQRFEQMISAVKRGNDEGDEPE